MQPAGGDLPSIKPEDRPYFEKILNETDDEELSPEEVRFEKNLFRLCVGLFFYV